MPSISKSKYVMRFLIVFNNLTLSAINTKMMIMGARSEITLVGLCKKGFSPQKVKVQVLRYDILQIITKLLSERTIAAYDTNEPL